MVDELTQQSFSTGKAVVEVATELIELLSAKIDQKTTNIQNNLSNQMIEKEKYASKGERSKSESIDTIKPSNEEIADTFEKNLKEQGIKYNRLSSDKFLVEAKNKDIVRNAVQQSAKEIAKEKFQNRNGLMKEKHNKKKETFKDRIQKSKQKAAKRDKDRQKNRHKEKTQSRGL